MDTKVGLTLEGRLAGPWVDELNRAWRDVAPRLNERFLSLDLRNLTYSDASGKNLLRTIYHETGAEIVTSSPWSQYLADEIRKSIQAI
ncbi:hypothetical protein DYQ86_02635 [Acidobacteria bacterium AB60]|nr:hypothetical protein DYQ86_02635 [Acidobacteria bacterium AB60]